jgi:threonine/homoserine/homoserine lactone efflux protein
VQTHVWVAFAVASVVISIVPGPDMLYIVSNAVAGGRRSGVVSAFGAATGISVHTLAAALGLSALIQAAPAALEVVRVVGAVVLGYLAVSTWLASRRHTADLAAEPVLPTRSIGRTYAMAVLTNLANPKVIVFYLAFFPQFVDTGAGWPVLVQFLVLGATLLVIGLAVDSSIGLLAGTAADLIRRRKAVRRWLERVSAAIFGALAVRLVVESR